MKPYAALALVTLPHLAHAFEPELPSGTRQLADQSQDRAHYELPLGVFQTDGVPTARLHGQVRKQSWRIEGNQIAIQELSKTLSDQLVSAGYDIVFHCQSDDCGGFDFRFDTFVLPPPEMFVDLSNFHFLSAQRDTPHGAEAVGLLLSHTSNATMLQAINVVPNGTVASATSDPAPVPSEPEEPAGDAQPSSLDPLTQSLSDFGHVVLSGLQFETGSSKLADQDYASLEALAQWLKADGRRRIALVGHTDSKGALEPNVKLSQARAASVERYLIETYGVEAAQIEAHGIGYLAPITSNTSRAGREKNRRVEAILISAP